MVPRDDAPAPTADGPRDPEAASATGATRPDTERPPRGDDATTTPSPATADGTLTSTASGRGAGGIGPDDSSRTTSSRSGERSGGSTARYRRPRSALEFAAQANTVATAVLNGEIDLDVARAYSGV